MHAVHPLLVLKLQSCLEVDGELRQLYCRHQGAQRRLVLAALSQFGHQPSRRQRSGSVDLVSVGTRACVVARLRHEQQLQSP